MPVIKTLIIIPAFNEQDNITRIMEEISEKAPFCDRVVINDGSVDNTAAICREKGYPMLDLPINLGLTGAFQTGMRYAFLHGYDAAVQIDGDCQHDPAYIADMIKLMKDKSSDIVIGSRYVSEKKPLTARMIGNELITLTILLTTGKRVTDPTSGMRLFNRRMIELFAHNINFGPEPDTISYLIRSGASVDEIQVTMRERESGVSYLNFSRSIRYMTNIIFSILLVQPFRKDL